MHTISSGVLELNSDICLFQTNMPSRLIGPLTIKGKHANGEFVVPMATLEGTLLASYSRGCKLMVESARQLNLPAGSVVFELKQ